MGPSGCGKTTTLRMLAGLENPSSGEIRFNNRLMNNVKPHERDTPLVWQSLALFPFLNVQENVEFGLKMRGISSKTRQKKSLEWLEKLEVRELAKRDISTLSGGQKQRLAIAAAIALKPKLLILDEPTSQLDPVGSQEVFSVVKELNKELGITIVMVSHASEEMAQFSDRLALLSHGEIIEIGSPQEIYTKIPLIESHDLRPPQVAKIFYDIKAKGINLSKIPVTKQLIDLSNKNIYEKQIKKE